MRSFWIFGLAMVAACAGTVPVGPVARPFGVAAVTYNGFGAASDFKNAYDGQAEPPSWLFPGNWSLLPAAPGFAGPVLHQEETGSYPHITIQRYAGNLFGPDGQLPSHYKVSVAVQPFESPDRFPPLGENAVLVYYRDPTSYVEVTVANGNVSVWSSDKATPLSSEGWDDHFYFGQTTAVGDIRRLACEIDTNTQELTYWVEGQKAATVSIPMLTHEGYHGFALRSHGNQLNFGELVIEGYAADGPLLPPLPEPVLEPEPVTVTDPVLVIAPSPEPIQSVVASPVAGQPQGKAHGFWKKHRHGPRHAEDAKRRPKHGD